MFDHSLVPNFVGDGSCSTVVLGMWQGVLVWQCLATIEQWRPWTLAKIKVVMDSYRYMRWFSPNYGLADVANCVRAEIKRHCPWCPKQSKFVTWPTPYRFARMFFSQWSLVLLFSSVSLRFKFSFVVGQCPSCPKKVK